MSKKNINKMTKIVIFERQLWPQPPKSARPHFCYINTLIFYSKNSCKELWRQEIPEALLYHNVTEKFTCMKVKYNKDFGWLLTFRATHRTAQKIFDFIFKAMTKDD